jgi:hypothetical protein
MNLATTPEEVARAVGGVGVCIVVAVVVDVTICPPAAVVVITFVYVVVEGVVT